MMQIKHQQNTKATSVFSGTNRAPRLVAIVPLAKCCDARAAVSKLNAGENLDVKVPPEGHVRIWVDRFKQNITYIPVEQDLLRVLDACRIADFVIFLLSAVEEVDETGELLSRAVENQGISTVLSAVQNLDLIEPPKRRPQITTSLKSYISHFFPGQEKIHSLDSHQDCSNMVRSLCTTTPKGVKWREDRSWMLVEEIQWLASGDPLTDTTGEVVLSGVVRGKGLNANRLVQVNDWGAFQIKQISAAASPKSKKRKADEMVIDESAENAILERPDEHQDDLLQLAPEEITMINDNDPAISEARTERRGVLLDDHHYFSDDETHLPDEPKRLPKGTSSYQAAWFLGDVSDSGSEDEYAVDNDNDVIMDTHALPQDGLEGLDQATQVDATEFGVSEYPQSEMFLDHSPDEEAEEIAAYRSRRNNQADEDLEFPDEIELHPNVLARERLARYRGLKSLRTSKWETEEDRAYEPEEWNRLLQISNYKGAKSQALGEALVGGVQPGTRVHVYLQHVPLSLRNAISPSTCLTIFSLLQHEYKQTVVNFSMTLRSDYPNSIKSKEELIMQCGPRRFIINPLFSRLGNNPNNVHKFDRYLHPGQTAIATFMAPLTWGSVPALFFKHTTPLPPSDDSEIPETDAKEIKLELIATGTCKPPDRSRIIAKRVILTGHPFKIHKKLVTVRYMFFNSDDVRWFKALQLWTKRGRSGFIKESLGTHGYFKATFDGKINPQDAVGVSLYKRVFPRMARAWKVEDVSHSEAVESRG